MFVAATVCPHPPLLVPEVAQGAAGELDDLRTACTVALTAVLDHDPDVLVVVGDGPRLRTYDENDGGTMRHFGADVHTGGSGSEDLPLALTIGAWLLDRVGWSGPRRYVAVPQETTAAECVEMGQKVAAADLRVGVLAVGDGSAKRSTRAPGYLDELAGPFDAEVARALAGPDLPWLTEQPAPAACAELWAGGRPAWQFLAGAATQTPQDTALAACKHYDAAPYGVGYFVVDWAATPG